MNASNVTSTPGENEHVPGDIPEEALRVSLRRDMVFQYFGNDDGKN